MSVLWIALAAIYGLFLFWHERRGPPLTSAETEAVLAHLAANRGSTEGPTVGNDHDLPASLRALAARDDGRQYFMVNLIQFRQKALYPEGAQAFGSDARVADARYSRIVLPQLLKRGSYPIFVSRVVASAGAGSGDYGTRALTAAQLLIESLSADPHRRMRRPAWR